MALLTPDQVLEGYDARVDRERVMDQENLMKRARKQEMEKKMAEAEEARKRQNWRKALRTVAVTACAVAVFSLVFWGVSTLLSQMGTQAGETASAGAKATFPPVDYLEPIR